ncbi:hypothetical protein EW026_g7629 [Hermanssonia centrifuga]|uniref:NADP-dependent oxidoreductase domain-containing protein n=1 Tax=Hermanssonia centrifuga TaxID=98765 RepID=A0A4S4K877_9APHY|nr:hypothetical protein EW026_g7629 [Hermanssonia centrifuga]
MSLPTRKIGSTDVTAIGYGAMGLSAWYGPTMSDEERFKVLDAVHARGCTFWDTSDVYGDSEVLIGNWHVICKYLGYPSRQLMDFDRFKRTGKRDEIFLATKFGFALDRNTINDGPMIIGTPEYSREAIDKSLEKLGTDHVDLWYLHRPDANVPIELTVGAMAEAVKAGKVKYIGLSECSEQTLRRAHAVHPIAAIQMEYAPFTLDIEETGLLKAAKELGVAVVAYSPLGRGLLTGQYTSPDQFDATDIRRFLPKYSKENFPNILKLVETLKEVAKRHDATPGQITLAWVLAQGDKVIPIPGTQKIKYLEENLGAAKVHLSSSELEEIRDAAEKSGSTKAPRAPEAFAHLHFVDTPALQK